MPNTWNFARAAALTLYIFLKSLSLLSNIHFTNSNIVQKHFMIKSMYRNVNTDNRRGRAGNGCQKIPIFSSNNSLLPFKIIDWNEACPQLRGNSRYITPFRYRIFLEIDISFNFSRTALLPSCNTCKL